MPRTSFARRLVKFCQQRATTVLSPRDADLFQNWLLDLLAARMPPPLTERDYDWHAMPSLTPVMWITPSVGASPGIRRMILIGAR